MTTFNNNLTGMTFHAGVELERLVDSDCNRTVKQSDVNKLAEKIKESGIVTPLVVSSDGLIIDGHHRHAACKKLKINKVDILINPTVNAGNIAQHILKFNNTTKQWQTKDYSKVLKLEEYERLKSATNSMTMQTVFGITAQKIKAGDVQNIEMYENYDEFLEFVEGFYTKVKETLKALKINKGRPNRFTPIVLWELYSQFDAFQPERALNTIRTLGDDLITIGSKDRMMKIFQEGYNKDLQKSGPNYLWLDADCKIIQK